jgi:hypothetical protein
MESYKCLFLSCFGCSDHCPFATQFGYVAYVIFATMAGDLRQVVSGCESVMASDDHLLDSLTMSFAFPGSVVVIAESWKFLYRRN